MPGPYDENKAKRHVERRPSFPINMYENIERCVQLHERLYVLYVVDGYEAAIYTADGDRKVLEAKHDDIESVLKALDRKCVNLTWEDIRKLPTIY